MAKDRINELATRIYEALKAKGADIGNASVTIIEAELNRFADDTRQAAAQDAYERASALDGAWQPMTTAPKDGSRILVCVDDYVGIAHWDRDEGYEAWRDADGERIESPEPNGWMLLPDA